MSVPFRGRYETKLDPKGRLSLPAALRDSVSGQNLVVTNSLHQGMACLDVYNVSTWEALEKRIQSLPQFQAEVQAFSRFYVSGGQTIEVDSQNRILVPQSLRTYAHLEGDLILVGMGGKLEIWSATLWNRLFKNLTLHFDSTMARLAEFEKSGGL